MKTTKELREGLTARAVHVAGAIRRMAITATAKALWKLSGFRLPDGTIEKPEAEAFTGIGFFARPPTNGKPEAIVLLLGDDAGAPVVVAVRDEKTRQAIVGALAVDETAIFNSASLVRINADGTIEARSSGGVAVELATKADLQKLEAAIAGATVVASDGGASLKATILQGLASSLHGPGGAIPWPLGTSKLKGE